MSDNTLKALSKKQQKKMFEDIYNIICNLENLGTCLHELEEQAKYAQKDIDSIAADLTNLLDDNFNREIEE